MWRHCYSSSRWPAITCSFSSCCTSRRSGAPPPALAGCAGCNSADLIAISVAIHLTGGVTTPFPIFYVLFIFTAVVLTPRYGTYVAAFESALCYALLVLLEITIWPPPANVLLTSDQVAGESRLFVYGWHLLTLLFILGAAAYMADRLGRRILAGEEIIQRQVGDLTLLYRFGDNLSAVPNLEQALQYIVTELSAILGAGDCSLILLNERNEAAIHAAVGISPEALIAYRKRPLDSTHPLLAAVLSSGTGVFAPDIEQIPGLRALVARPAQSFYSFPLRTEARILGLINFSFTRPYTMPPSTYDLVAACSRQASLTIERTLLYQEAQRAAREMSSLYHIGLAASSSLEINSVLSQIADQIQMLMTPELAGAGLLRRHTGAAGCGPATGRWADGAGRDGAGGPGGHRGLDRDPPATALYPRPGPRNARSARGARTGGRRSAIARGRAAHDQ